VFFKIDVHFKETREKEKSVCAILATEMKSSFNSMSNINLLSTGDMSNLDELISGKGKVNSKSMAIKSRSLQAPYKEAGLRLLKQLISESVEKSKTWEPKQPEPPKEGEPEKKPETFEEHVKSLVSNRMFGWLFDVLMRKKTRMDTYGTDKEEAWTPESEGSPPPKKKKPTRTQAQGTSRHGEEDEEERIDL